MTRRFGKRWIGVSNKTLRWMLVGFLVGLVPQQAAADDLDSLMNGSVDGPSDRRQQKADAKAQADGQADADAEDNYIEPDPWERPPADDEPPPKKEQQVIEDDPNPPDGRRLQLGLALGYGIETEKMINGANAYGLGFGIRGGYTLDMGMFVGLSSSYYLGSTVEDTATGAASLGVGVSAFTLGVEAGYDVWTGDSFLLRPSAELGLVVQSSGADAALPGGRSLTTAYLAPGVTFLMPFVELFYVGVDARLLIAFGDDGDGTLALSLVGGSRLDI